MFSLGCLSDLRFLFYLCVHITGARQQAPGNGFVRKMKYKQFTHVRQDLGTCYVCMYACIMYVSIYLSVHPSIIQKPVIHACLQTVFFYYVYIDIYLYVYKYIYLYRYIYKDISIQIHLERQIDIYLDIYICKKRSTSSPKTHTLSYFSCCVCGLGELAGNYKGISLTSLVAIGYVDFG